MKLNSVCVYCGSGHGADPVYQACAQILGQALAEQNIRLVYGGGSIGLMGTVARAVIEAGGKVTGIIPKFLASREIMLDSVDDLIITEDMHERKQLMFQRADAFVALPGGVGTLEELVEQLTWAQLGRHSKPILLANIENFWAPLLDLLAHMSAQEFIRKGLNVTYHVVDKAPDIVPKLQALAAEPVTGTADAETLFRL
jgi:uncharacterized protein (TIGR00730 family)